MVRSAERGTNKKNLKETGDTVTPVKTTEEIAAEVGLSERSTQQLDHFGAVKPVV